MRKVIFEEKVHEDGSFTMQKVKGGNVSYYHPFRLLKKDYSFPTENLTLGTQYMYFGFELFQTAGVDNRITTSTLHKIGEKYGLKRTAINNIINNLAQHGTLIKLQQGLYKVHESISVFKTSEEDYKNLQKETANVTNITNNIIVNNDKDSESLMQRLLNRTENNDIGNI